jgi:1,4-dihydroxy-2-naphthoate octaprenyltransferase
VSRGLAALAFAVVVLAASALLITRLQSLDADREAGRHTVATLLGATGTRVLYSVLVVSAYALLPIAWAAGAIATGSLAPFLSAPLAMRLGDVVSHRSGDALGQARREAVLLVALFAGLFVVGSAVLQ